MNHSLFSKFLVAGTAAFISLSATAQSTTDDAAQRIAHLGFVYPVSTNGIDAAQYSNGFSFHALIGVSGAERNCFIAGLGGVVKGDVDGLMLSGLFNKVGGSAAGAHIAGVTNIVAGEASGVQLAGLMNRSKQAKGLQLAGLTNISQQASGMQMAGLMNHATVSRGVQVAGLINSSRDADNQVAGLINVAKKVKGLQLAGLINIAEDSDYPIGVVNVIKNGEMQIGLSIDERGNSLINLRSGGRVTYGILGVGYNFTVPSACYVLEAGLGMHIPVVQSFRINPELVSATMTSFQGSVYFRSTARVLAEVIIAHRFGVFAGPSINYLGFEHDQEEIIGNGYLWKERKNEHYNGLYWGATAGIHFNL